MLILAVDDERLMLRQLHEAIEKAESGAEILDFSRAKDALDTLSSQALKPDVVFTDIEMPGMNGLNFAVSIKQLAPKARIVFVTAYSEYALDAYRQHVNGYLLKPVEAWMVREELDLLDPGEPQAEDKKLQVRCFGYFDLFKEGRPVVFSRAKTKELLAYLIDREGGLCTGGEIASALWEDEPDERVAKHRLRTVLSDLRKKLRELGAEELLIREKRQLAIRPELLNCDYYRMLKGDMEALNSYRGEYMLQYSWAELTGARLQFKRGEEGIL